MKKWRCKICGYIYKGEILPEECPVCGAGREFFEEISGDRSSMDSSNDYLQKVLFNIPCGLFVVSSFSTTHSPKYNGMINNTVFQLTDQPLRLILGMDKQHLTTEYIKENGVFAITFLTPNQLSLVKQFGFKSGRELDKYADIGWRQGTTGAPLLEETPGYIECRLVPGQEIDAGTHLAFLGEVVAGQWQSETKVLTYQEYRSRKRELWIREKHG